MISKIVLQNFMSHTRTELELAPCLTVLTGPNNCGKSAVVAALQTLCGHERGSFMVRHGEKECRVTVEMEDGHTVVWQRVKGTASYQVDGRDVHRVEPDDLHEHLRLPRVKAHEKDEFDIHFGEQKQPIFLIGQPASRAATFFASSSDAEYMVRMQKIYQGKVTGWRSESKRLRAEINGLDERLATLEPLDILETRLTGAEETFGHLAIREKEISSLTAVIQELKLRTSVAQVARTQHGAFDSLEEPPNLAPVSELSRSLKGLRSATSASELQNARNAALGPLSSPPDQWDIPALNERIEAVAEGQSRLSLAHRADAALEPIQDPPSQHKTGPLWDEVCRLTTARADLNRRRTTHKALEPLPELPEFRDADGLSGIVKALNEAQSRAKRIEGGHLALKVLPDPPVLLEGSSLGSVIQELRGLSFRHHSMVTEAQILSDLPIPQIPRDTEALKASGREVRKASDLVKAARNRLREAEELARQASGDIKEWLALNPNCPTCGSEIDFERVLGEAELALV